MAAPTRKNAHMVDCSLILSIQLINFKVVQEPRAQMAIADFVSCSGAGSQLSAGCIETLKVRQCGHVHSQAAVKHWSRGGTCINAHLCLNKLIIYHKSRTKAHTQATTPEVSINLYIPVTIADWIWNDLRQKHIQIKLWVSPQTEARLLLKLITDAQTNVKRLNKTLMSYV